MPDFALYPFEQRYEFAPGSASTAVTPMLAVEIDPFAIRPFVFFDPGRQFSFVGRALARVLPWRPVPILANPVPSSYSLPGRVAVNHVPIARADLLTVDGVACEFGEVELEFVDCVQHGRSAPLTLSARFATAPTGRYDDLFLCLGASFVTAHCSAASAVWSAGVVSGKLTVR